MSGGVVLQSVSSAFLGVIGFLVVTERQPPSETTTKTVVKTQSRGDWVFDYYKTKPA